MAVVGRAVVAVVGRAAVAAVIAVAESRAAVQCHQTRKEAAAGSLADRAVEVAGVAGVADKAAAVNHRRR